MSARVVRCDYERLAQLARGFGEQADCHRQLLERLKQQVDTLQNGDWVGQGATAFFREMNGDVLPAQRRLVRALGQAALTARSIERLMREAEADAARALRVTGAAVPEAPGVDLPGTGAFGAAASLGATIPMGAPAGDLSPLSIDHRFTGRESAAEVRQIAARYGYQFSDSATPVWDPRLKQWLFREAELLEAANGVITITEQSPANPDVVLAKSADLLHYLDCMYTDHPPARGEKPFPLGKFTQAEALWLHANQPEMYQRLVEARAAAAERLYQELQRQAELSRRRFGQMMEPVGDVAEALGWGAMAVGGAGMALTAWTTVAGGEGLALGLEGAGAAGGGATGSSAAGAGAAGAGATGAGSAGLGATGPATEAAATELARRYSAFVMKHVALEGGHVTMQQLMRICDAAARLYGEPMAFLP